MSLIFNKTKQNKTKQNKTKQNKTKQTKTKQNVNKKYILHVLNGGYIHLVFSFLVF